MVRKRISLTAQTAGCLPLKCTHLSQFRSCLFVCRCRYCFFFVFQFSPQRTFQAHLSRLFFYPIRSCPLRFKKKFIQRLLQNKIYLLFKSKYICHGFFQPFRQITNYKLQISITAPTIVYYYFVQRHQLSTELEEVKI